MKAFIIALAGCLVISFGSALFLNTMDTRVQTVLKADGAK